MGSQDLTLLIGSTSIQYDWRMHDDAGDGLRLQISQEMKSGRTALSSLRKRILLVPNDTIHKQHDRSTTESYLVVAPRIKSSYEWEDGWSAFCSQSCEVGIVRRLLGIETGLVVFALLHRYHIILRRMPVRRHI